MMLGSRLVSLAARPRPGFINFSQRTHLPPVSYALPPCTVNHRKASRLAGQANPTGALVNKPSSSEARIGYGSAYGKRKVSDNPAKGTPNYKIDLGSWEVPSIALQKDDSWQRIPNIWLRDNCRCSQCVNQDTMQRNYSIFDLPHTLAPVQMAEVTNGLKVIWDHEQHESFYTWDFLERYRTEGTRPVFDPSKRQLWGSEIANDPPTVDYHEVMDDTSENGMAKLTDHLMRYGLAFVDETPFDDAVHTKKLLERIGPIRETHYGGFYDFVPDMAKADTAYTNIALPAHTDTTYFTDPAGLQAFHMLSHTPSPNATEGALASGGESLLVDGFRAAELLRSEQPHLFDSLHSFPVPWHASGNKGVTITPDELQPVIQLRASNGPSEASSNSSSILRIRWNNDDRGVPPLGSASWANEHKSLLRWYEAARKWNEILKRSSSEFWFQLRPGRTLIFDNYRVLHGRSAFTGMRRICGAYISRDDFISRWRNTNLSRQEVLAQVIG